VTCGEGGTGRGLGGSGRTGVINTESSSSCCHCTTCCCAAITVDSIRPGGRGSGRGDESGGFVSGVTRVALVGVYKGAGSVPSVGVGSSFTRVSKLRRETEFIEIPDDEIGGNGGNVFVGDEGWSTTSPEDEIGIDVTMPASALTPSEIWRSVLRGRLNVTGSYITPSPPLFRSQTRTRSLKGALRVHTSSPTLRPG